MRFEPNRPRCLTLYFYGVDAVFGFVHVRLSTWLPYDIQVYVNGHQGRAKRLDKRKIGYRKVQNAFISIDDYTAAQMIADHLPRNQWIPMLEAYAKRVNCLMKTILKDLQYRWVADQVEYATDIIFKDPPALSELYLKLQRHSAVCIGAEDVMRYLGKRRYCSRGELIIEFKKPWVGARVKHRLNHTVIKMYDKFGLVLRVETVINRPYEFLVRRWGTRRGKRTCGWFSMTKGIANLWRYVEVSLAANKHYLDALSAVDDPSAAYGQLKELCEPVVLNEKRSRGKHAG